MQHSKVNMEARLRQLNNQIRHYENNIRAWNLRMSESDENWLDMIEWAQARLDAVRIKRNQLLDEISAPLNNHMGVLNEF